MFKLLPEPVRLKLRSSEIARRIARGSAWSFAGAASSRVCTLIAMILLARMMGAAEFGELAMVQVTLGVAGMMAGFGLGSTATRFLARDSAIDKERAGQVLSLVQQFSALTLVAAMAVVVLLSEFLAAQVLHAEQLGAALRVGALLMGVAGARGVQAGVFAGFERFDINARLNVLEGVSSMLLSVALAWLYGIEGALFGLMAGPALAWAFGWIQLRRLLHKLQIRKAPRECWRQRSILTKYSLPSFLASFVSAPILWLGMTMVAREPGGYTQVALYNAAYQWHGPLIFLPMVVLSASLPALTQEWHSGDPARFKRIYLYNLVFLGGVTLVPALLLCLASVQVMGLYGPEFRAGWPLMVLLALAAPLHAVAKMSSTALLSMNRAWSTCGVNLLWGVTLVGVGYFAIPRFGATGLAAAFVLAYGLVMGCTAMLVLRAVRNPEMQVSELEP
ncbi:MAG TPA: oligosaccharide flippase family protein [Ramlibacter sp.]